MAAIASTGGASAINTPRRPSGVAAPSRRRNSNRTRSRPSASGTCDWCAAIMKALNMISHDAFASRQPLRHEYQQREDEYQKRRENVRHELRGEPWQGGRDRQEPDARQQPPIGEPRQQRAAHKMQRVRDQQCLYGDRRPGRQRHMQRQQEQAVEGRTIPAEIMLDRLRQIGSGVSENQRITVPQRRPQQDCGRQQDGDDGGSSSLSRHSRWGGPRATTMRCARSHPGRRSAAASQVRVSRARMTRRVPRYHLAVAGSCGTVPGRPDTRRTVSITWSTECPTPLPRLTVMLSRSRCSSASRCAAARSVTCT